MQTPAALRKTNAFITHAGTIDITNIAKSLENGKYIADPVRSKLPNCKQVISNIVIGKDKNEIEEKQKKICH